MLYKKGNLVGINLNQFFYKDFFLRHVVPKISYNSRTWYTTISLFKICCIFYLFYIQNEEITILKRKLSDSIKASESAQISRAETINRLTHSLEESQKRCRNLLEACKWNFYLGSVLIKCSATSMVLRYWRFKDIFVVKI